MTDGVSAASSSSVIAVPDGTRWDEGAVLEFQTQGELAWIRSVSSNNLTAVRGIRGSTATTQASGVAFRDPVYTFNNIINAANLVIQDLPQGIIYKKVSLVGGLTYVATKFWYNLAADAIGLISVNQISTGTINYLLKYGKRGSGFSVVFSKNLPTALVASGTGLAFPNGWYNITNVTNVDYAAKLTTTQTVPGTYDDFSDGLDVDLISYGVAARLIRNYEINRVSDEDTGMGDQSVQPGMRASIGNQLFQEFLRLRSLKAEELRRDMPLMGTAPSRNGLSEGYSQHGWLSGGGYYP